MVLRTRTEKYYSADCGAENVAQLRMRRNLFHRAETGAQLRKRTNKFYGAENEKREIS